MREEAQRPRNPLPLSESSLDTRREQRKLSLRQKRKEAGEGGRGEWKKRGKRKTRPRSKSFSTVYGSIQIKIVARFCTDVL